MIEERYDVAVWIGRAEPPHIGHVNTIIKAFDYADDVLVVFGTANSPRTIKNPWTVDERGLMVRNSVDEDKRSHLFFIGQEDLLYSDMEWLTDISKKIRDNAKVISGKDNPTIALVAHAKDDTSYYINYFKFLDAIIDVEEVSVGEVPLSSTKIRELYFEGYFGFIKNAVPDGVYSFLNDFKNTDTYSHLLNEYHDAVKYEEQFSNVPYGNSNFLTADAVVFQSGHVLLVKRKSSPGKGLWALPGGHVQNDETFMEASIRELREETQLKVPEKVLKGSLITSNIFDHPDRSLRCRVKGKTGRTVTMAFSFKLNDEEKLPRVKGNDDADVAWWFPVDIVLNEMRNQLFEDHWDIISYMASRI